jgi:hypothetical protein
MCTFPRGLDDLLGGRRALAVLDLVYPLKIRRRERLLSSPTKQGHPSRAIAGRRSMPMRALHLRLSWQTAKLDAAILLSINSEQEQQPFCTLSATRRSKI